MGKFVAPDWQLADLAYLTDRHKEHKGSANWSEMGCYKTSTVLWLAQHLTQEVDNNEYPSILINTTPSGKGTYYEAIPEILPDFTILDVTTRGIFYVLPKSGGKRIKMGDRPADEIKLPHVILSHYNVFMRTNKGEPEREKKTRKVIKNADGTIKMKKWNMVDYLLERHYNFVGIDEAHRMKNRNTKWTDKLKKLDTDYRHVMTGTGFINRPDEIWSLLNFIWPTEFRSYWKFRDYFCEIEIEKGIAKIAGLKPEKIEEFRNLVREVGVRRTLDEVMPHIKKPIFVKREVELSVVQRSMYNQIKSDLKALDQKGTPIHSPNVISALNRMRQICVATPDLVEDYYDEKLEKRVQKVRLIEPSRKLDDFMELLTELQWDDESKQQVIVFSNFKDPLELLKVRLDAKNISYIHMEQSDSDEVRYDKWFKQFPKKEHQIFMSTLQLGSESINLTSARHIVFLDRSWSPKDNQQGIGRVRRPGQDGQPVVINIEAEQTTDQRIEDDNIRKVGWFDQIFGKDGQNG